MEPPTNFEDFLFITDDQTCKNLELAKKKLVKKLVWQSNVKISKIPSCIFDFSNLEEITIKNNQLEKISPKILNLKLLKVINFSYNKLKSFPFFLSKLENLRILNLDLNEISNPTNIQLKKKIFNNLTELRIGANNFTHLDWVSIFPKLEKLFVFELKLNTRYNIPQLKSLIKLDLDNCQFKSLIDQNPIIPFLENLEWLMLRNTGIFDLNSIPSLPNLKYLFLPDNNLTQVNDLTKFPNLIWAILINNQIKSLKIYKKQMQKLELLNLSNNPLLNIPNSIKTDIEFITGERI